MKNKETIKLLKNGKSKFTVKDVTDYKNNPIIFEMRVHCPGESIEFHSVSKVDTSDGMNVDEFGPYSMKLYTFTPFNKKFTQTIKYSDITFIED